MNPLSINSAMLQVVRKAALAMSLAVVAANLPAGRATAAESGPPSAETPVATVDGKVVNFGDYRQLVQQTTRDRFYHGKPPQAELNAVAQEVLRGLIDRVLFEDEIKRRGIGPDRAEVDAEIAGYDRQYGNSPQWSANREKLLPGLRKELESRSSIAQLRKVVTEVAKPTRAEVEAFYKEKSALFTEPERSRVSAILLRVDPSSLQHVWDAAMEEGKRIRDEIAKGANFAEMAKKYSSHESAPQGGDLGYLHAGMLATEAETALKALKVGEVSPAIATLDGVILLRLDSRIPARLRGFKDVRERAEELLLRERREAAWNGFRDRLYRAAKISIDDQRFPELQGFSSRPTQ